MALTTMPFRYYSKWIAPAILFFFLCVCLGYWTHRKPAPSFTPPFATPAQK